MSTVIITGGRNFQDKDCVYRELEKLNSTYVVCGDARGADSHAVLWATVNFVDLQVWPANWEEEGRAAGPLRNKRMLLAHPKAIVIAFPGGKGTANCVAQARKLKMHVVEVTR